jgi:polysaccharide pyruvyl transferase WcaK-like protein
MFGLFGTGNLGNDASLASALDAVRARLPEAVLLCVCGAPEVVAPRFGLPSVAMAAGWTIGPRQRRWRLLRLALRPLAEIARLATAFRQLRGVDQFVVPGTGYFDDFGVKPAQTPLDTFRWLLMAHLRGADISLLSVGAGPIHHPASRQLLTRPLRWARYCSFRDVGSREFMTGIDPTNAHRPVAPDLVFSLPVPSRREAAAEDSPPVIGVGVMAYYGWGMDADTGQAVYRSYLDRLTQFTCLMLDAGHTVEVGIGDLSDRPAAADLVAAVRSARPDLADERLAVADIAELDDVLTWTARCDVVVATRFHNVICGLMTGCPVVALGYSGKFTDLMIEMGLEASQQHVESFEVARLAEDVTELLATRPDVAEKISRRVGEYRDELAAQYDLAFGGVGG